MRRAGYISQHLEQKVTCLSVVCSRKKQAWWLIKWFLKYSTEVRFVLEIPENPKVIASELSWKCDTPLENPPGQNRRSLNYVTFLLITLVDSTSFLIYSKNSAFYNFHPQSIPCLQIYSLGFFEIVWNLFDFLKFSGIVWFGRMLRHRWVVDENCIRQQNFKEISNIWKESALFSLS